MHIPGIELWSERFGASGGFAAEGVKKLLGTPKLSLLQTVLRETVQNTWDARNGQQQIRYLIRLRRLKPTQIQCLSEKFFHALPHVDSGSSIRRFLTAESPIVMEIADWGTSGLAGPTRADLATGDRGLSNFVNFVRNIGIAHPGRPGGGTYGYGKSSVYLASNCSTILVDTLAKADGLPERRLIAAHLGEAYEQNGVKFTGRHWWGVPAPEKTYVEPLLADQATACASALGLPQRSGQETGTTIMILGAILPNDKPSHILNEIQEAILWHFWPKMLDDNGPLHRINFQLEVGDRTASFPAPEQFPPLDLFIEAYRGLKRGVDTTSIESKSPKKVLGRLAMRRGFRNDRHHRTSPDASIIPSTSSHIAVMRPVELVVRYFQLPPLPNQQQEWAGVFICDDDVAVERAFAASEPPAHDDWVPEMLPRGNQKTYVNVALRRIKEAGIAYAQPPIISLNGGGGQPPLARAADRLGAVLLPAETGFRSRVASKGKKRTYRPFSISEPSFIGLEQVSQGVQAIFEIEVENASEKPLELRAAAGAIIDGSISTEVTGPDGGAIEVKGWETHTGVVLSRTGQLTVPTVSASVYRIRVSVPPMCAVGIAVEGRQPE